VTLREQLYSDFIKDFGRLIHLYELVSRIRLMASSPVVKAAEDFVKQILMHFAEENLTIEQLQNIALTSKVHPLQHFSEVCRVELQAITRNMKLPTM